VAIRVNEERFDRARRDCEKDRCKDWRVRRS
jgi:hypothetical protein